MANQTLVANELLAFLQQKLDVMDEVSAVQICKSSFSEDDISKAKKLLYESLNKSDQMVSRRRDGTQKSLQDIISLLKVTDPDDVPTFVARDLNKLPPVTFDHVDVTSLLKDIITLKAGLADMVQKFHASEKTVSDLRKEVNILRESLADSRSSPAGSNINMRRGACLDTSTSSCKSAVSTPLPPRPEPTRAQATRAQSTLPAPPASVMLPSPAAAVRTPLPSVAPHVTAVCAPVSCRRNFAAVVAANSKRSRSVVVADGNEGVFTTVQSKKARRRRRVIQNRRGTAPTGPNFLLRAATPTTAMYLSRLHYTTTVQEIAEYIKMKTNFELRVEPLNSRHNTSFKAFVVLVPSSRLDTFMSEGFWPKGVVYRRFRGQLPSPATDTTLRVSK